MNACLKAALRCASRGKPVFAVSPQKRPWPGSHGYLDATIDPEVIRGQFTSHPDSWVALATGRASRLVVVDLDRHGENDGFRSLSEAGLELPPTLTAATGGGGAHLYYQSLEDVLLRSVSTLGGLVGVDVRAERGYVILPPSPGYMWVRRVGAVELPSWVADECAYREGPHAAPDAITPADLPEPVRWLNANRPLHDLLRDYGYEQCRSAPNRFRTPGHRGGFGIVVKGNRAFVHSTCTLPGAQGGAPRGPFDFYCHHEHGGNIARAYSAIRELMRQGAYSLS